MINVFFIDDNSNYTSFVILLFNIKPSYDLLDFAGEFIISIKILMLYFRIYNPITLKL